MLFIVPIKFCEFEIRRDSSIMWDNGVAVVKRRRKRRRRKGREEEDKEEGEEMWGDCLLTSNE